MALNRQCRTDVACRLKSYYYYYYY